ncbi:MAG: hypothetical protein JXX14_15535 [Deltaproteobacteria bacterium]|nr:hypothetical protein [Deltaproteobacteria bacterium]
MKKCGLILIICLFSLMTISSCSDSDDDAPPEKTKNQVVQVMCSQLSACNAPMYEQLGGDSQCVQSLIASVMSDDTCPAATFDTALGGECAAGIEALSCDQFNESVAAMSGGTEGTSYPDACDSMCGGN